MLFRSISGGKGTAAGKIKALREAGAVVTETPDRIGAALEEAVRAAGIYDACVTCEKTI